MSDPVEAAPAPAADPSRPGSGRPRGPFTESGAERLAASTVVDPSLVRVADLAARLLGAGAAQVSMVLDEQTVVGGAAGPVGGGRTAAAATVCEVLGAAVMRTGTAVLVDDVAGDPRVRAQAPGSSGAYLGVPLVSGGHAVGVLGVLDVDARHWTPQDLGILQTLAAPVLAERELAALETAYEGDRLLWELAVEAAGVGVWDWDLRTGELRWDDRLLSLFGQSRDSFGATIEAFSAWVHPDDRDRVARALDEAIATCGSYAAEYRVPLPDGTMRWVGARGRALAGPGGNVAVRVLGAAYDTTAVQVGEARLARVMEAMPSGFLHLDREWRLTHVNPEAQRLLGVGAEATGRVLWELFPAAVGSVFETRYREAVAHGRPVSFEAHYPEPLDGWFEVRAWPTPEGLSVYFLEVTDRHQAQESVRRAAQRSALIAEVTSSLVGALEEQDAASRLARLVVPTLGDWCLVSMIDAGPPGAGSSPRFREIADWHADPEKRELVARYARVRGAAMRPASPRDHALAAGEPVVIAAGVADVITRSLQPGEAVDLIRRLDPQSAVLVPMRGRGRTTGLVTVLRDRGRAPFADDEVETLVELTARAGVALDNVRAFGEQRALAEDLQRTLLTPAPRIHGVDVAVRYEPATRAAQVGGDWYDVFELPGGTLTLVIGDVIGHDTAAAAAMGQLRSLVRGIAVTTGAGPAELLRSVDAAVDVLQVETTATAVVAHLERGPGRQARLRWSTAGHPPPLLAVPDPGPGEVRVTQLSGDQPDLLLGLDPETSRAEDVVALAPGATVLLYTDGLVERRGEGIDDGTARLAAAFGELMATEPGLEGLCEGLLAQMLPERPDDDVALVALRLVDDDRP